MTVVMSVAQDIPSPISEQRRHPERSLTKRILYALGPGLVTGAADDDPSGVATYAIAGARLGPSILWTVFLTTPLMAAIQMACARVGMISGRGLMSAMRLRFPAPVIMLAVAGLVLVNTINIAADLSGMADAASLLTGVDHNAFIAVFGIGITYATVRLKYRQIAKTLKWLVLALFAYVAPVFLVETDWGAVAKGALIPTIPTGAEGWQLLLAVLGTTISPSLFFWQASEEVEVQKQEGKTLVGERRGAAHYEVIDKMIDVGIGMVFSNVIAFFIILSSAMTLHNAGITEVKTSTDVAGALRPIAGNAAMMLYTIGIVGAGLLAIPTFSGSTAYALADIMGWEQGLDKRPTRARAFYAVIVCSTLVALLGDFMGINAMKAMLWASIINGFLAPFLLILLFVTAANPVIMAGQPSGKLSLAGIGIAALLLVGAVVADILF